MWLRLLGALVVLAVAVTLLIRSAVQPADPTHAARQLLSLRDRDDVNVVFILIDTLRADRLGSYGYARPSSPFLDELATRGVLFEHTVSPSSWTKPAMASIFTGQYPLAHGVQRAAQALPEDAAVASEVFGAEGYRTAAVVRNHWVTRRFGFAQGFEIFFQAKPEVTHRERESGVSRQKTGFWRDRDVTSAAIQLVRNYRDERFFLYVHLMGVHAFSYEPAPPTLGRGENDRYDNAVAAADHEVRTLVEAIEEEGLRKRTLFIITSDHGEAFLEHGTKGHGQTLHAEEVRVPLLLVPPFPLDPPLVISAPLSSIDIFPTVLDLLGLDPLQGATGRSLVGVLQAGAAGRAQPTPALFSHHDLNWGLLEEPAALRVAMTRGRFRLIQGLHDPRRFLLYDVASDPREREDLAPHRPQLLESLKRELLQQHGGAESGPGKAPNIELDDHTLQLLRGLGYVIE